MANILKIELYRLQLQWDFGMRLGKKHLPFLANQEHKGRTFLASCHQQRTTSPTVVTKSQGNIITTTIRLLRAHWVGADLQFL